jgi:hypothetical protein
MVVRLGEREESVTVRRLDGEQGYEVTVGDRTYRVDVATVAGALSLRLLGASDGVGHRMDEQHEVAVRPQGGGVYQVATAAGSAAVEVVDPRAALARRGLAGKGGKRRARVNAYMPGRVVAVLAAEGTGSRPATG